MHLVMDNYGTHKVAKVRSWLARHPRYHVHFTPTSGSWLNLVERLFGELIERCVRRASHTAVRSLEKSMLDYLDQRNQNPKPFAWTADTRSATHPQGVLPTYTIGRNQLPDLIDGAVLGRRQKIRRAVVAHDGHSSGEQLLYRDHYGMQGRLKLQKCESYQSVTTA